MKLLVFTENYARGGGNRYLIDLVNGMAPAFDAVVLASNPGGLFPEDIARLVREAEVRSVPVLTSAALRTSGATGRLSARAVTALDPIAFQVNVRRLTRLIADVRPDVMLVCNGGFPAARSCLAAAVAAGKAGVPLVFAVVGMPIPRRGGWKGRYEAFVDDRVWAAADAVVTSGSAILRRLEGLRGLRPGCGRVLANALPDRPPAPRQSFDEPTIGCVTRITRSKGMVELADAFVEIAGSFPTARLRVVGEGPAVEEIRRHTKGLEDRVELPGFVSGDDAVAEEVARLDVYVLPTYGETHPEGEEGGGPPYSILEAMRAGIAVVTTRVGSIEDGMTDGCDGLLVPPQDAHAVAEAVAKLLGDDGLRRRLGDAARERFVREFTLPRLHEKALALAQDVLSDRRGKKTRR